MLWRNTFNKCFFLLITALSSLAQAASPAETLRELVGKVKSTKSAVPIVDYVNWDLAFKDMADLEKQKLNINSASDLKKFFTKMLTSPSEAVREKMEERVNALPADKQPQARQGMQQLQQMLKAKEGEIKERLGNTEYKVQNEKIEGDKATVQLVQTYNNETKTEDVKLQNFEGRWLLPTATLMSNKPPHPSGANNNPHAGMTVPGSKLLPNKSEATAETNSENPATKKGQ